jgi:hypothetical protein
MNEKVATMMNIRVEKINADLKERVQKFEK